jgi:hypothetical protein
MQAREINPACTAYLEDHAAYIDDCLSETEAADHEAHAAVCASCSRYARVLSRGLSLVRELPEVEPSPHFEERLRHRIFHLEDAAQLEARDGRSVMAIAAAAMIAVIAWSPMVVRTFSAPDRATSTARSTGSAAGALMLEAQESNGRPHWYVQPARVGLEQAPVYRIVSDAGSYSPLIVSPPGVRGPRAVRLVSANTQ